VDRFIAEIQSKVLTGVVDVLGVQVGKLNLVDLAGSERVRLTGATGQYPEKLTGLISLCTNPVSILSVP
jgi:hypothetical protein